MSRNSAMTGPCLCWSGPVAFHQGHCCLRDGWDDAANEMTCGHTEAALALRDATKEPRT